jgi:threonine/homoserine/homoserine lactone efflux protein
MAFTLDLICFSFYVYLGSKFAESLVTKLINKVAGSLLIFAGFKMAVLEC